MPVYKDKARNTWLATFSFYDNRGVRKSFKKRGFKTKREALEWEAEHRGQMTGSLEISFKTFVEDTYLDSMTVRLKPDTMAIKRAIIETHLMPYFGEMRIDRITSKDVFAWQNAMLLYRNPSTGKPYTPSYLKTMQNQLVAIFSFAVRFYGLKENPVRIAGSLGSSRQGEMKFWTLDQFRKFEMAAASEPMWACAFGILFWCGLREGEMLALTPADFNFEKKSLASVEQLVNYAVRALMVVALFIGSCLLCTVPVGAMETTPFLVAFPIVGSIGYVVSVFFAWRLYKSMKKDK